jgi:hypothetical protein
LSLLLLFLWLLSNHFFFRQRNHFLMLNEFFRRLNLYSMFEVSTCDKNGGGSEFMVRIGWAMIEIGDSWKFSTFFMFPRRVRILQMRIRTKI